MGHALGRTPPEGWTLACWEFIRTLECVIRHDCRFQVWAVAKVSAEDRIESRGRRLDEAAAPRDGEQFVAVVRVLVGSALRSCRM